MTYRILGTATALMVSATAAFAQQPAAMTFRLTPGDRNPSSCAAADASMSRVHTVTVAGDVATIKSNGGISDKAKSAGPGKYATRFSLSGLTLDITVDTSASPATLTAAETKLGCKWTGTAS